MLLEGYSKDTWHKIFGSFFSYSPAAVGDRPPSVRAPPANRIEDLEVEATLRAAFEHDPSFYLLIYSFGIIGLASRDT